MKKFATIAALLLLLAAVPDAPAQNYYSVRGSSVQETEKACLGLLFGYRRGFRDGFFDGSRLGGGGYYPQPLPYGGYPYGGGGYGGIDIRGPFGGGIDIYGGGYSRYVRYPRYYRR